MTLQTKLPNFHLPFTVCAFSFNSEIIFLLHACLEVRVFLLRLFCSPRVVRNGKRKKAKLTIRETMEKDVFRLSLHSDGQMGHDIVHPNKQYVKAKN